MLFVDRWRKDGESSAYACFFPAAYDKRRWPVSTLDLGIIEGRPYACLTVYPQQVQRGDVVTTEWVTETNFVTVALLEP